MAGGIFPYAGARANQIMIIRGPALSACTAALSAALARAEAQPKRCGALRGPLPGRAGWLEVFLLSAAVQAVYAGILRKIPLAIQPSPPGAPEGPRIGL